jgi:hypothetical protein
MGVTILFDHRARPLRRTGHGEGANVADRRVLVRLGHEVRLMPPAYVKPYVKRGKTDAGRRRSDLRGGDPADDALYLPFHVYPRMTLGVPPLIRR